MLNVIVTGGSRGIGLGIAKALVATGYRVIAVARTETSQLTDAIAQAESQNPGSMHFAPFDLADIDNIPKFVKMLRRTYGPIHGLVNNAGISFDGVLAMMRDSQIAQLMRVNTLSPIILTKHIVRSMMADGTGGRIANIASITGFNGYSGLSVYGATKASLIGFTRSLAREVGPMQINVNAVAPGFVDTEMTGGMSDEDRQRIIRRSALRRLSEIDDIGNAVVFLLGEQAKNITGTVLTVDAGCTA